METGYVQSETQHAVELHLDIKGVELLIATLQKLKEYGDHLHLYATNDDRGLSMRSPYREGLVHGQLILNLLPSEAWTDAVR